MIVNTDNDNNTTSPRTNISKACFHRTPWTEKLALILIADEVSWPACIFILECLLKKIIETEKREDSLITSSKASPLMRVFDSDNDDFRLHHYFDLICGAGIGGLAAPMLGHLRLSLQETVTRVAEVLDFPRLSLWRQLFVSARLENSRQIHTRLHFTLEPEALRPSLHSCNSPRDACHDNASQFVSVPGMCQTLVFGAHKAIPKELYVFKSYQQPSVDNTDPMQMNKTTNCTSLVNVCRVAMANPSYFEHVNIRLDPKKAPECMVDTAAKDTDLSLLVEQEGQNLHDTTSSLQCLLEIGGQAEKTSSSWRFPWSSQQVRNDSCHSGTESKTSPAVLEKFCIKDLNMLAHYITKGSRTEADDLCLARGLYDQLESCARTLVKARRARSGTVNWEIFAFPNRYSCSICRKEGRDSGILDKPAFFDHVDFIHDFYALPPPEMFKIQTESSIKL